MEQILRKLYLTVLLMVLNLPLQSTGDAIAQAPVCTTAGNAASEAWRKTPTRSHAHADLAISKTRMARDEYWSSIVPSYTKVGQAPYIPTTGASIPYEPIPPTKAQIEFFAKHPLPKYPDRFWVEAKFEYADTFETRTESIYTEVHLRILRSVGPVYPDTPAIGQLIDLDQMGGCLAVPSGEVHEYWMGRFEIQPGHTYLMQIHREPKGEFFGLDLAYMDVTSGVAKSVSPEVEYDVQQHEWPYAGLTEPAAIRLFEKELASKKN